MEELEKSCWLTLKAWSKKLEEEANREVIEIENIIRISDGIKVTVGTIENCKRQ